jgi:acetoin utilization deacetylase AcuC-like enzyme
MIHNAEYIARLADTAGKDYTYLDPDTQTCPGSFEAALLAAGGLCQAISLVCSGDLDNAFALVRPPGHHAESGRAMGFCLFNNVAIGARFAQRYLNMERVLVVDWDLHHGNGTQHSFEDDNAILYFSTHQFPYYPGSGAYHEVGTGKGEGYTVNVPMSVGNGDGEFVSIFELVLKPIVKEFNPQLILVSAGFDIYMGDPLGGMDVTPEGFAGLTRSLMNMADLCCDGRVVITLEGGYNLQGMRDSAKSLLMELADLSRTNIPKIMGRASEAKVDAMVEEVQKIHRKYWKSL